MFSVTVRLVRQGDALVCSHVAEGARHRGGVTLRDAGDVKLCRDCEGLAHTPGALKYRLPGERREKVLHRHEHIDRYVAERTA